MGATITQKIMARAAGRSSVATGEVVWVTPDLLSCIDMTFPKQLKTIQDIGVARPVAPEKIVLVVDHEVPAHSPHTARVRADLKRNLEALGIEHFYDAGRGIGHQLVVEEGFVLPGGMVIGADTHANMCGAVGALSVPVNAEMPTVLALDRIWLQVPETIKVVLSGTPRKGVLSRDIAHWIIAGIGAEAADYRVLEFCGPALAAMDMDQRMTLCNLAVDVGAKTAIICPDDFTMAYLAPRARGPLRKIASDPDAEYAAEYHFDIGTMEPMVAAPPSPDNVVPISAVAGVKVDQAYVGSCASGRMEDLRAAASVLRGRRVHPRVTLLIVPTSQAIFSQATKEGLVQVFVDAGATVTAPTCGPCFVGLGQLADGEVCIGSGTRNEPGRKGSTKADIYLANALTIAASAVKGEICDPREFLE